MRLAQASSSEFHSKWGEPGDQRKGDTSKSTFDGELNIVLWGGTWDYMFRAKMLGVAEKIATFMEAAAKNPYIGYSQNNGASPRTTLYDEVSKNGWDASKVNVKVNCDCSSLVSDAINAAGIPISKDMWTGDEYQLIMATGAFDVYTNDAYTKCGDFLKRGDILLRSGHTAVAIDDGIELDPYKYIATGNVYLRKGPSTKYSEICTIPKDSTVYVLTLNGNWAQCVYNSKIGYASLNYLGEVRDFRATGDVWMRSGPGILHKGLQVIYKGTKVKGTGYSKNVLGTVWYECSYNGITGWCSGKLLR